jgi:hypothetical protein
VGWAEVHRIAGEIAPMWPEPDAVKVEAYLERALAVARKQQAKSWELRAAMSMVRLWRDQGKTQQARELLAPVYGWFTEGFDTRDLKEAKTLLNVRRHPMLLSLQRMRHDTTPCRAQSARRNVETRFIPVRGRGHQ